MSADREPTDLPPDYETACRLAEAGEVAEARRAYARAEAAAGSPRARAVIRNDLAALSALGSDV